MRGARSIADELNALHPPWASEDPWLEADVIANPDAKPGAPKVLVRRRASLIIGQHGEEMIPFPGPPAISLFTGAGGMDLGLEAAGFCTAVQHEWNEAACQTLIINRPRAFRHAALIQGDIRLTPTSMLLGEAGLRVGEARLLAGGPPCQGFSTSNSNRGKGHDPRNDLVFEYLRVVRESQPHFFIFENVPGFPQLNGGAYLKAFLEAAYGCYYELVYGLVDAVEYGVPQYRCRFICMGTRRDLYEIEGVLGSLPAPQHFAERDREVIETAERFPLLEPVLAPDAEMTRWAPGIRYFPDRPVLVPPRPIGGPDSDKGRTRRFIEFYRDLKANEPDRVVFAPRHAE